MSGRQPPSDPLATLVLPNAIRAQASKLLCAISSAAMLEDSLRATFRAEGFALRIETVRALNGVAPFDLLDDDLEIPNVIIPRKTYWNCISPRRAGGFCLKK